MLIDYAKKIQGLQDLLEKARSGKRPIGLNCALSAPELIEIAGHFEFDYLIIDQEHTLLSGVGQLANFIRAAELTGLPIIVKLNWADFRLARDAFDAGAHGVLAPYTDTAHQLREFIDACKFPPEGSRGFCSLARATFYASGPPTGRPLNPEYINFVNNHAMFIGSIESVTAVENLEQLLAIPEVEVYHVGPEDLELTVSAEGRDAVYFSALLRTVTRKIEEAGKQVMMFSSPLQDHDRAVEALDAYHNRMPWTSAELCLSAGYIKAIQIIKESLAKEPVAGEDEESDAPAPQSSRATR